MQARRTLALGVLLAVGAACSTGGGTTTTAGKSTTRGASTSGSSGVTSTGGATSGGGTGTGGAGARGLGGVCDTAADCQSSVPLCATQVPLGYCTKTCNANGDCPSSGQCISLPFLAQICVSICNGPADCLRDGYTCDPSCGVCVPRSAVGQVSCPNHAAGLGGRAADGGVCGPALAPASGPLTWSASVDVGAAPSSGSENEGAVAVDGAGHLVAAFIGDGGQTASPDWIGVAASNNAGASFTLLPPLPSMGDDPVFDPSVAFDSSGTAYLAYAGYVSATATGHLWVATAAADGGFGAPVEALNPNDAPSGTGIDKPFLTIDPMQQLPVVTYATLQGAFGGPGPYTIRLNVGAAGGGSFNPGIQISDRTRAAFRDLPALAFDSSGEAYLAWAETTDAASVTADQNTGTALLGSSSTSIRFAALAPVSGGGLLSPNLDVASPTVSAATDQVVLDGPKVAVAVDGSALFVAYVVANGNNSGTEVMIASSTAHGETWGAPVRVNDDPGCATHFHPWPYLDTQGRLWVTWIDNRNGLGEVMYAVSSDQGQTFSPAQPVSDVPLYFTTLLNVPGWLGGYQQLTGIGRTLVSVWTGSPHGTGATSPAHVFVQKATLP